MECKFSTGSIVLVNDSAEVANEHIGETAVVVDCFLMGVGEKKRGEPIEYANTCLYTLHFDDDTVLTDVPETELSPL